MKKIFIIFLFILSALSSFAQQKSDDFNLKLYFISAFDISSTIIIDAKDDSAFLKIHIRNTHIKPVFTDEQTNVPIGKLMYLINFLDTYKFPLYSSLKKSSSNTNAIKNTLAFSGDSITHYPTGMFWDGMIFYGYFTQDSIKHAVLFKLPSEDKTQTKFIAIVLDLLNDAFTKHGVVDYLELLYPVYNILGLRKLSDNPLTYKLFGGISSNGENDLYNFLTSLPRREKVIIDMSNYSEMPSLYYPNYDSRFSKSEVNRKEVYWLNPTEQGLKDLHKMGVPEKRIIRRKD